MREGMGRCSKDVRCEKVREGMGRDGEVWERRQAGNRDKCQTSRLDMLTIRVGQNHTFIGIYYIRCMNGIFGRKSPYVRSYTVCMYGSGQL